MTTKNFDPWRNTSLWKPVKIHTVHTWCWWWTLKNEQTIHGHWSGWSGSSDCFHKQEIALHTDGGKAAWMFGRPGRLAMIVMEGREYFFPYALCNGCYEREIRGEVEPEQRALARLTAMIRRNT